MIPAATSLRGLCACALMASAVACATDISASGIWSPALRSGDLAAGAGGALRSTMESPAGQAVLIISNAGSASWEITVRSDGTALPAGVQMSVRVAAPGSGAGVVSAGGAYLRLDGGAYLRLDGSAQTLLSGTGDRTGVLLQFRLDGTSVHNAVGHYSSTVIYSLR